MADLIDLQRKLDQLAEKLPEIALGALEVEGVNFVNKNFRDQGYNDNGLSKWKPRKTTDRKGRDLTRKRNGELTKFGRENIGRAILVGHNTGGDKLKNSFRTRRTKLGVIFFFYKGYMKFHNEGTDKLPKRQFIGNDSKYLDEQVIKKINRHLDQIFRQ